MESVALVERDGNTRDPSGARLSWVFPSMGIDAEGGVSTLASRAQLMGQALKAPTFVFSRWQGKWWYSLARQRRAESDVVHASVSSFAIIIGSDVFDPERYGAMLAVLLRAFDTEGGSPMALLQRVLSIATKGSAGADGGADFVSARYSEAAARLACPFSAMLRQVGAGETVGCNLHSTPLDSPRLDATRLDLTSLDLIRLDLTPLRMTRLDSTRLDSTRLHSTRLDSTRLDSTRLDSSRLDSTRPDSA